MKIKKKNCEEKTTKCHWITVKVLICWLCGSADGSSSLKIQTHAPLGKKSSNHWHPVSPSLALTCEKTNKVQQQQAVPSLSLCHHCFLSSTFLSCCPTSQDPWGPPPTSHLRRGLTSPTHVSCQLWPLKGAGRGRREKGKGKAKDVCTFQQEKRKSKKAVWKFSVLHNFVESDPLWVKTEDRETRREDIFTWVWRIKKENIEDGSLCNTGVCWNIVCLRSYSECAHPTPQAAVQGQVKLVCCTCLVGFNEQHTNKLAPFNQTSMTQWADMFMATPYLMAMIKLLTETTTLFLLFLSFYLKKMNSVISP